MRVCSFYFDLLFGFLFFWRKEWDNRETKGDADATWWMNVKFNECLLTATTTQQMSLCEQAVSIDISMFNFFLFQETFLDKLC